MTVPQLFRRHRSQRGGNELGIYVLKSGAFLSPLPPLAPSMNYRLIHPPYGIHCPTRRRTARLQPHIHRPKIIGDETLQRNHARPVGQDCLRNGKEGLDPIGCFGNGILAPN